MKKIVTFSFSLLSICILLSSIMICHAYDRVSVVNNRNDGTWFFPAPRQYYDSFSDWAGCPGAGICGFHNYAHNGSHGGDDWGDDDHTFQASIGHNGIDISMGDGTEVYAAASGTVVYTFEYDASRGSYVILEHPITGTGYSYYSYYQHLSAIAVRTGSTVYAGQKIAYSGHTGGGCGPHLHFGIVMAESGTNISSRLYSIERNGWLDGNGYAEKSVLTNPSVTSIFPQHSDFNDNVLAPLAAHSGSVKYTFNINEVTIGCSHNSGYKTIQKSDGSYTAVCKSCGSEYQLPALNTSDAGIYKTTAKIILNSAPYKESQVGNEIAKGTSFTVVGSVLNAYGNKWYQTKEGQWIYKDYLTRTGDLPASLDKLSISGENYPSHLDVGDIFIIHGTVKSEHSNIKSLTVGVYDENGNEKTGKTVYPNSTSYDVYKVDVDIRFDWLTDGTYYYRITASNSSGTTRVLNQKFTVGNGSSASTLTPVAIAEGYYTLTPACAPSSKLDVSGGSAEEGANIQIWGENSTEAQMFRFTSTGNGYYSIAAKCSGMVLDVWGGVAGSEVNIAQHNYHGGNNQQWQLTDAGSGCYTIRSRLSSNYCIDVSGGSSDPGTNVWLYEANGTDAQRWKLTPVKDDLTRTGDLSASSDKLSISGANSTDSRMLTINWDHIRQVGHQTPYSSACGCYAAAYCRTILDGYPHYYSEYNLGTDEDNANASWSNASYGLDYIESKQEVLQKTLSEIDQGRPVILEVTGIRGPVHYVTVVGYENVSSKDNLSISNFLIIDPVAPEFKAENMSAAGHSDLLWNDWNGKYKYIYSLSSGSVSTTGSITPSAAPVAIAEGYYTLTPACAPSSKLDVSGGSEEEGANIQIWGGNNTEAQIFRFTSTGNGYYSIAAKCSGMVLDVWGGVAGSEVNIAQHDYHGENNQQWQLTDAGSGYYTIRSRLNSNYCIDVSGGSSDPGTNVWLYESNGTDAQRWKLTPVNQYYYYLDLNGFLDEKNSSGLEEYGTADVYINGSLVANDVSDYYIQWESGTSYEIKDIKAKDGYVYNGLKSGSLTGKVESDDVSIVLSFSTEKPLSISDFSFSRWNIYSQGQFTDVPANQWFTSGVAEAFELGLMKGTGDTTFTPYGDVTLSEAITMAARIHSIYTNGSETIRTAVQGEQWYQPYLDYAYENGIIRYAYYICDVYQRANRAQFAEIFAAALPDEALCAKNSVADNAIPDVKASDSYAPYVYKLYRAGVLAGGDVNGTFSPETFITRAEAATIVARMGVSANRVSLTLK